MPQSGYRVLAVITLAPQAMPSYLYGRWNQGNKAGTPLKAETNGSAGADNVLTAEEIKNAECIIIAADKNVEMARFDGKPLIQVPVAEGIHHGEELVKRAVSGTVPVYHHSGSVGESERGGSGSSDSSDVKVPSHERRAPLYLPFVIGGGILIALAFLFDDYEMNPANFGKNTPLAAYLKTVGEQAFGMMLPVLAGYIAMSIADRPGTGSRFCQGSPVAKKE